MRLIINVNNKKVIKDLNICFLLFTFDISHINSLDLINRIKKILMSSI